eukprot:760229-Rhodomonas_salina.3
MVIAAYNSSPQWDPAVAAYSSSLQYNPTAPRRPLVGALGLQAPGNRLPPITWLNGSQTKPSASGRILEQRSVSVGGNATAEGSASSNCMYGHCTLYLHRHPPHSVCAVRLFPAAVRPFMEAARLSTAAVRPFMEAARLARGEGAPRRVAVARPQRARALRPRVVPPPVRVVVRLRPRPAPHVSTPPSPHCPFGATCSQPRRARAGQGVRLQGGGAPRRWAGGRGSGARSTGCCAPRAEGARASAAEPPRTWRDVVTG